MNKVQITLGENNNAAEVLLNKMVQNKLPINIMVVVASSLIHSCETGMKLDTFEKTILNKLGYESFCIIDKYEDYIAMKSLEIYLDEELPDILNNQN